MSVKITILYDNRCENVHLQEGWGFSALVEFEGSTLLFDTGGDAHTFFSNAEKMHLPYHKITQLLFSHKHWDHIAGFEEIIEKMNPETAIYIPKTFPLPLRQKASAHLKKVEVVDSLKQIVPNIYSLVLEESPDLYEQVLVLNTSKGLGIITGCAHPGIVQIIKAAQAQIGRKIAFVLGGFHLLFTPGHQTAEVVREFQALGVEKVAPCHCSGDHLIRQFREAYGSDFYKVGTGAILTF